MASTEIEHLTATLESVERRLKSWIDNQPDVWLVLQCYCEPEYMIDSVWLTEGDADKRCHAMNNDPKCYLSAFVRRAVVGEVWSD